MKILYITKRPLDILHIRNNLSAIAEGDSICIKYSYQEAEDFITNHIVALQEPLDLIITENNIEEYAAHEFLARIKKDHVRTYSNKDFYFHSIPVVLIVDVGENPDAYRQYQFSDVLDDLGIEKLHLHVPAFRVAVKHHREKILGEADAIGIGYTSSGIDYTGYFAGGYKNFSGRIMTVDFFAQPRKLEYSWLTDNPRQLEIAIDSLDRELKRALRKRNKKDEDAIHALFNKYPSLIRRDNYSTHWHESKLYYSKNNFYEPDFSLKPNFSQLTDLSILEVKLPTESFALKTNFHPRLTANLFTYMTQVNNYKDYFEEAKYTENLKRAYGFVPTHVEYNILIGQLDDKNASINLINKQQRQFGIEHINFITYQELLNLNIAYYQRFVDSKLL